MNELIINSRTEFDYAVWQTKTEEFHTSELDIDEYDELSDHDKKIADIMTDHEEGIEWEHQPIDYETAMKLLIELLDANPGHYDVRWCSVCGKPFFEGYYLGGDYACSDECRNAFYRDLYDTDSDEEAYKAYLLDCHDVGHGKGEENMTVAELEEKYKDAPIGDEYYYTNWF